MEREIYEGNRRLIEGTTFEWAGADKGRNGGSHSPRAPGGRVDVASLYARPDRRAADGGADLERRASPGWRGREFSIEKRRELTRDGCVWVVTSRNG